MWTIFGQDHLLKRLEPSLRQRRQSHAYLLSGPPHVGKMALAINLAQAVNCLEGPGVPCGSCSQCTRIAQGRHADIRTLAPGKGETCNEKDGLSFRYAIWKTSNDVGLEMRISLPAGSQRS